VILITLRAYRDLPLQTPCVIIDIDKLEHNIAEMARLGTKHGIKIRPHVKSHKIPAIALKQIEAGASGITCAKLGEAEVMAKHGIDDILIANQIYGKEKISRLIVLNSKITITVLVDNPINIQMLDHHFKEAGEELKVLIEIDTGHHRCGCRNWETVKTCLDATGSTANIIFSGIETHEGHVYKIIDLEQRKKAVDVAMNLMNDYKQRIETLGYDVETVSVGSTPSSRFINHSWVTEMRPGNYALHDLEQVSLGSSREKCALSILATVISRPDDKTVIIDGGVKTFGFDRGKPPECVNAGLEFVSFSEEHGKFVINNHQEKIQVGDVLEFLPYHACPLMNLHDTAFGIRGNKVEAEWVVEARGKLT